MRVGIATPAAGRRLHLRRQSLAVARLRGLERYVVVAMDGAVAAPPGARRLELSSGARGLPLAAARNLAVRALGDLDLVILLDVDCIPTQPLVDRYVAAAARTADPALWCGPVGYLDPLAASVNAPSATERRRARSRVIRAFPERGARRELRHELFWSLSFAVAPRVHAAIGGFDEGYEGYGAEDTDYGLRAAKAGVGLWMVGGAWAYHQHHEPSPPRDLANLIANARRFHASWGWWPMPDRLTELAAAGRIEWTPEGSRCELRQLRTSFL